MTIRVPSAGDAPDHGKGPTGDLLVRVNVATSKIFRRQGSNIYHDARIPLHTALLGGRVRVPTLDGEVDVRVPGGTQQGQEMVLKSRGIQAVFGGGKGDLFVTFAVQIPRQVHQRVGMDFVPNVLTNLSDRSRIVSEKFFRSTLMTWKAEVLRRPRRKHRNPQVTLT
jgi:DnaJ-class molecular chaperone